MLKPDYSSARTIETNDAEWIIRQLEKAQEIISNQIAAIRKVNDPTDAPYFMLLLAHANDDKISTHCLNSLIHTIDIHIMLEAIKMTAAE